VEDCRVARLRALALARPTEAARLNAEVDATLAVRAAGKSPWGSELSPLFLRLVLERLEWEPAMCGVMRAVCSTWGSILDSLLPRVVPRGSATVMKGKLGWYQSVVEVDLTRWRTTPGLLLGYFQTQVSVCELSLGGELHDEGPMEYIVVLVTSLVSATLPAPRRCAGRQEPKIPPSSRSHKLSRVSQDLTLTTQGTVPRRVQ
jgi:hypothetical protein